jgi:outer membrane protein insertion porin family
LKIVNFLIALVILTFALSAQTLKLRELNSISFEGNESIPEHRLKNVLFSKETPNSFSKFLFTLSPSLGNPPVYFDSLLLAKDVKNLLAFYKANGFFKTKIKYEIALDGEDVNLKFIIDEGPRARFGKIETSGFDKIPPELSDEVATEMNLDSTMFFSANAITKVQNDILETLQDNGFYAAAFGKTKAIIDTNRNKVDVKLRLNLGRRYKIGKVSTELPDIEYSYVQPDLIKEIVDIKPGEWFNKTKIAHAEARIYRTDLFSSSLIQFQDVDTVNNRIPLLIKVNLKPRNDISPELIANNEDNVFNLGFSLGYTRRNFFGGARKLNLQASATLQDPFALLENMTHLDSSFYGYSDIRLGIEQPFLFGKPIYTKLETYYTLQNRRNEYYSQIYGVRLLLDFTLPKFVYFNGLTAFVRSENSSYHYKEDYVYNLFKNYVLNNVDEDEQQEVLDSLENSDLSNFRSTGQNFFIGFDAIKNSTDDFRFPTKGYSLSLHLEDGNNFLALLKNIFSSAFNRPQYAKVIINTTYYPEFFSTYTSAFGVKFKVGEIYLFSGNKNEIPLDERLYAGGSNSVRGWKNRELVPSNSEIDINTSNPTDLEAILLQNFTPGGFSLIEGSFEYRKKLIGNFGSAVFVDYGNTWLDFTDFRWDEIAVAIGFGFRYYTDFFPIRFDFGFKFYDPADRRPFYSKAIFPETFTFHLGIGEAF